MTGEKKIKTVSYILNLTEKEMNTVMIAIGHITPRELNDKAETETNGLQVLTTHTNRSQLDLFYDELKDLINQ